MATRIIEYGGRDRIDGLPIIPESIVVQSAMTATGTTAQSPAFNAATNMILIDSDETIHISRGSSPTATTDNFKVKAGEKHFFSVKAGQKVAIITGT